MPFSSPGGIDAAEEQHSIVVRAVQLQDFRRAFRTVRRAAECGEADDEWGGGGGKQLQHPSLSFPLVDVPQDDEAVVGETEQASEDLTRLASRTVLLPALPAGYGYFPALLEEGATMQHQHSSLPLAAAAAAREAGQGREAAGHSSALMATSSSRGKLI